MLEAAVGAHVDRAEFAAMWRSCMRSLAAFGAAEWFLEDVGRRRQGGAASSVVQGLRGCSQWFEAMGGMHCMQGTCGNC